MELSQDQSKAARELAAFLKSDRRIFKLSGSAGCGKTTLLAHVLGDRDDVTYCAPTAKAASVLRDKGQEAVTLHSLLLQPCEVTDPVTRKPKLVFKENPKSPLWNGGVVCIDESSMVPSWLAEMLVKYPIKVIAVGDPFQLPPVRSTGSLLTGAPDATLTQVHRTALDSPVLELATYIRQHGKLPGSFDRGGTRIVSDTREAGNLLDFDVTLVGKHATRFKATDHLRRLKGRRSPLPEVGETVLAKVNDREKGLINGCTYEVKKLLANSQDEVYTQLVASDGTVTDTTAWKYGFQGAKGREKLEEMGFKDRAANTELWFGDCITVHSSQGSAWENVLVVDEGRVFGRHHAKFTYTAVTRASESVTVVKR